MRGGGEGGEGGKGRPEEGSVREDQGKSKGAVVVKRSELKID